MSWSPDLFIGEARPWPDSVHVVRGRTEEERRYFPRETRDMEQRESIVRCRDCESATDHCEGMDVYWCEYLSGYVGADMFCAWGERRDA